jgi:predicted PurR-regulated permease PerM
MQQKLETTTFLFFLFLVSLGFILILKPFFGTIFWACAIAVIFYPLQQRLLKHFTGRINLTAFITLIVCILIVILPVIILTASIISEGAAIYQLMQSGEINPAQQIEKIRTAFPGIQIFLERFGIDITKIKETAMQFAMSSGKFLAQQAISVGQDTFTLILNICLMLYLTFFLLRDGTKLLELLIRALPLGDARERLLFAKFGEVTRATIKGNLVVALVQGTLGGLIFWFLGIPGALLWGVLMAFASLIPAVGPALIWAPVALYLVAAGEHTHAIILTVFGVGVIGLVDNVLRPILVGRDTKLPDYLVLLSTLGGIGLFGINGFVIGPLVAALFIAFWGIFIREINLLAPDETSAPNENPIQQDTNLEKEQNS